MARVPNSERDIEITRKPLVSKIITDKLYGGVTNTPLNKIVL